MPDSAHRLALSQDTFADKLLFDLNTVSVVALALFVGCYIFGQQEHKWIFPNYLPLAIAIFMMACQAALEWEYNFLFSHEMRLSEDSGLCMICGGLYMFGLSGVISSVAILVAIVYAVLVKQATPKELQRYECPALLFGLSYPVINALVPAWFGQYGQVMSYCWLNDTWSMVVYAVAPLSLTCLGILIVVPRALKLLYGSYKQAEKSGNRVSATQNVLIMRHLTFASTCYCIATAGFWYWLTSYIRNPSYFKNPSSDDLAVIIIKVWLASGGMLVCGAFSCPPCQCCGISSAPTACDKSDIEKPFLETAAAANLEDGELEKGRAAMDIIVVLARNSSGSDRGSGLGLQADSVRCITDRCQDEKSAEKEAAAAVTTQPMDGRPVSTCVAEDLGGTYVCIYDQGASECTHAQHSASAHDRDSTSAHGQHSASAHDRDNTSAHDQRGRETDDWSNADPCINVLCCI
jgi:hypothetical protein